jgi:hypothetical protein
MYDLASLTVICGHLNDLNSTLQGKRQIVSELYSDVLAFEIKLALFNS